MSQISLGPADRHVTRWVVPHGTVAAALWDFLPIMLVKINQDFSRGEFINKGKKRIRGETLISLSQALLRRGPCALAPPPPPLAVASATLLAGQIWTTTSDLCQRVLTNETKN